MYHFELSCGESPDLATVKVAPLESYVGLPWGVKESDAPSAKLMLTDLPRAGSAGQLPSDGLAFAPLLHSMVMNIPLVKGLHVV